MTVKRSTLYARLRRGWTMRQAEGKDPPPVKPRGHRPINPNSLRQRAMAAGVPISTVEARVASGMTLDEALTCGKPNKRMLTVDRIAGIIRRNLFDDDEEYTQVCRECAMDILSEKE